MICEEKKTLRRRPAPSVGNDACSHKMDNFLEDSKSLRTSKLRYWFKSYSSFFLNPEGHQNGITGSRVTCSCAQKSEFFLLNKVVQRVGGGTVINGAYPV